MSFKICTRALNEKTFGIKNKIWVEYIGATKMGFCFPAVFLLFLELFLGFPKLKNTKENASAIVLIHSISFMIYDDAIVGVILLRSFDNIFCSSIKTIRNFMLVSTPFSFFYLFNPFILEQRKNAHFIYDIFKYYFWCQTITVPITLLISIFATWILWKMSKVKPDYDGAEPYLVIYGGEDSSTKKLLDDFE